MRSSCINKIKAHAITPETSLFQKRKTLYGLAQAMPSIIKSGRVVVVEGYIDVIACHQYGPGASWRILAKPGSDPLVVQEARGKAVVWSTRDMARRFSERLRES